MTRTVVRDLEDVSSAEHQLFSCEPKAAVVAAFEQARDNWNTWDYLPFDKHPESFEAELTVVCGDFAAFKSGSQELAEGLEGLPAEKEEV